MTKRKALIAGGGIGGLCAAIGLKKIGWQVEVYEQAPELREVGSAVQTWSNCSNAMDKLGILDEYAAMAASVSDQDILSTDGDVLINLNLPRTKRLSGYGGYSVHRHELIELLAQHLDDSEVFLNSRASGIRDNADSATLLLEDGREVTGDILIGADGLNSATRGFIDVATGREDTRKPRYAGFIAWRGIADMVVDKKPPGYAAIGIGLGIQLGYYPMTKGRTYWFVTKNCLPDGDHEPDAAKQELLNIVSDWVYPFHEIVTATPIETILRNDICDFAPESVWGVGRITLLGDAAHATTPNLGQGACMAVEDAVELASRLKTVNSDSDIPQVLRGYELERARRTRSVVKTSRIVGELIQTENRYLGAIRDGVLCALPSGFVASRNREVSLHKSPVLV